MSKKKMTDQQLSTKINFWVGLITLSAFIGAILSFILFNSLNKAPKTSPQAQQTFQMPQVQVIEAKEDCESKLGYIRCASRNAGLSDKDGSMLIRIARAESYCDINPEAVNYLYVQNPKMYSAVGSFMITNGTWKSNKCTGNRFDHEDSTDCAIKIYKARGTQPWNESKHLKSGNGWSDENQCYKAFK